MLRDYYVLQGEEIDDDYDCGGGYEDYDDYDDYDYYDDYSYDDYDYDEEKEEEDMSKVVGKVESTLLHAPLTYEPVRKKTLQEQLYKDFTYICEARLRFGFNGDFITAGGVKLPLSSLIKTDNSLHPYGFKNFPGAHSSSLYSYYSNGMTFPRGGREPGELDDWDIVDFKPTDKYHFIIGMPQYMSDTVGGFKAIADKCLGDELFGEFELLNGTKFYSYCLDKTQNYYRACDTDNGIGVMLFDEEGKCHNQYNEIPEEKVFKFTPHTFRWDGNNEGLFRLGGEIEIPKTVAAPVNETKHSKTWEEYCKNAKGEVYYYSPSTNQIAKIPVGKRGLVPGRNKWTLPTLELAEKMEAYFQLLSIHEDWVQGWKPDWSKAIVDKHCIEYDEGVPDRLIISKHQYVHHSLCFPTWDMANEFCKAFKDLLFKAQGLY